MATINNGTNANVMTPLDVKHGGTGINMLTPNSILLGADKNPIASLGVATNGQIPMGVTGQSPVLAHLTAGQGISITNGPGSITISVTDELKSLIARVEYLERRRYCKE